jgi:methionyl-tRNA formyltransferase
MGQFDFSQLQVEWDLPAQTLSAWIRARIFPPFQLPWAHLGGQRVEILKCRADTTRGAVGELLQQDSLLIGARYGSLQILQARLASGKVLTGEQLVIENGWQVGSNLVLSSPSPAKSYE